jgi:hypothetical protein
MVLSRRCAGSSPRRSSSPSCCRRRPPATRPCSRPRRPTRPSSPLLPRSSCCASASRSRCARGIKVFDGVAEPVAIGRLRQPQPNEVVVPIAGELERGSYTVVWRAISADLEAVNDFFVFHVGAGRRPAEAAGAAAAPVDEGTGAAERGQPFRADVQMGTLAARVSAAPAQIGPNRIELALPRPTGTDGGYFEVRVVATLPSAGLGPFALRRHRGHRARPVRGPPGIPAAAGRVGASGVGAPRAQGAVRRHGDAAGRRTSAALAVIPAAPRSAGRRRARRRRGRRRWPASRPRGRCAGRASR